MTAVRSFQMASKTEVEEDRSAYEDLSYEFKGDDGKHVVVMSYPGSGSMAVLISSMGVEEDEGTVMANVLNFIRDATTPQNYRFIMKRVRTEEVSLEMLMDMIKDMIEAWSAFPTQPPSASTPSRRPTGTRSTGRAPGAGSTRAS